LSATNVSDDDDDIIENYGNCSNHSGATNTASTADPRDVTSTRDNMAAVDRCDDVIVPSVGALPLPGVGAWWDSYEYYRRCQQLPLVAYAWQLMWARAALLVANNDAEPRRQQLTPASESAEDDRRTDTAVTSPPRFHPYLLNH